MIIQGKITKLITHGIIRQCQTTLEKITQDKVYPGKTTQGKITQ